MSDSREKLTRESGIVTTPLRVTEAARLRADEVGAWFDVPVRDRQDRSLKRLFSDEMVDVVVVADTPIRMYHRSAPDSPIFFHPGIAMQRIRGIRRGERDRLVDAAGLQTGDSVLDATLGHGGDALVAAHVVGDAGQVVGVEGSWFLNRLLTFSQRPNEHRFAQIVDPFSRIQMEWSEHETYLGGLPSNSVDVILFDPMFRVPPKHLTDIEPGRPLTLSGRLSTEAFEEAKRVARRAVVLKERPGFGEFERFNLVPDKPKTRFAYGVWHKERF